MQSRSLKKRLEEMKPRIMLSGAFLQKDKDFIEKNYEKITYKKFKISNCNECYKDAFIEMYNIFKKMGMRDLRYTLKAGVVLQCPNDKNVYTNTNLTDEISIKYLRENPERINFFAKYPQNWKEEIKRKEVENERSQRKEISSTDRY